MPDGFRSPDAATRAPVAVFVGAWLVLAALASMQIVFGMLAEGLPIHSRFLAVRLAEASALVVYVPALALLHRVAPPERVGLVAHLLAVLGGMAIAVAVVLWLSVVVGPLFNHGKPYFRGSRVAKGIGEFFTTAAAATIATAWSLHRRLRERDEHALQLEVNLADARLRALTSQLHPHFLFNTLNAASTLLHRDPAGADAMLGRLAELLRATLRQPAEHEIPLREEMALLERYVDIMRIRHGSRLSVETVLPDEAAELLVPPFVLQPLVENAIEHGVARRAGPGAVTVRASRLADRLRLEVTDDGPGVAGSSAPGRAASGIGLNNTRRRLEQLYGDAQRLTLEHQRGVGTRAVVELPARAAAASGERA